MQKDSQAWVGQILDDRYEILDYVGHGAMGEVYRGRHILMDKEVAIKFLHPVMESRKEILERFKREAKAASRISHPNICQVTDFGQLKDETFYMVMEFLDGQTLSQILKEQAPLDLDRTIGLAMQIASGLGAVHEAGIVHRDLKPENIFILNKGDAEWVKIVDFGVAKAHFEGEAKLSHAGNLYGTPQYMSPEQAQGTEVDIRSDLYSLGVLIYEMIAGKPPFEGDQIMNVLWQHINDPPKPFKDWNIDVPKPIQEIVFKLLQKDPNDRYQNVEAFLRDLEAIGYTLSLSGSVVGISITGQKALSVSPKPKVLIWSMGTVLVVIIGIGTWWLMSRTELSTSSSEARSDVKVSTEHLKNTALVAQQNTIRKHLKWNLESLQKIPEIQKALERIEQGQEAGLLELIGLSKKFEDNAAIYALLADAHSRIGKDSDALTALDKLWNANAKSFGHPLVQTILKRMIGRRKDKIARPFYRWTLTHMNADVALAMGEAACFDDHYYGRERALKVLRKTQAMKFLEDWLKLGIQLRHSKRCDASKALIRKLVELGDPRGVKPLKVTLEEGTNRKVNRQCLAEPLKTAIKVLEEMNH